MKWSWKIGRFAGIDVYLHATFFLLIGWIAVSYWIQENSIAAVISGVGFILALFGSVVLHEYGHALTARKYGVKTRDITMYPIGGVASLERIPDDPKQEFWVALAGPAVNVVIAVVLFAWLGITSALEPITTISLTGGSFIERLMITNLFLVGLTFCLPFLWMGDACCALYWRCVWNTRKLLIWQPISVRALHSCLGLSVCSQTLSWSLSPSLFGLARPMNPAWFK